MSTKTVLALIFMILIGTLGDVLISKGMKQVGEITSAHPAALLRAGTRALQNPIFVTGVVAQALYFCTFSAVLSWTDVSVVVPIGALSHVLTAFIAQHALGEHVTPQRWAGTIFVVIGITLVVRSQVSPAHGLDTHGKGAIPIPSGDAPDVQAPAAPLPVQTIQAPRDRGS